MTVLPDPPGPHVPKGHGNPLTAKLGPLPAWAWAAIAIGIVVVWRAWQARANSATVDPSVTGSGLADGYSYDSVPGDVSAPPVSAPAVDTTVPTTDPLGGLSGAGLLGLWTSGALDGALGTDTGSGILTNTQWATVAADKLMAAGADPVDVQNALANYFAGNPLTSGQSSILKQILAQFGSPPEGVAPITVTPDKPPSQATPAPSRSPLQEEADALWTKYHDELAAGNHDAAHNTGMALQQVQSQLAKAGPSTPVSVPVPAPQVNPYQAEANQLYAAYHTALAHGDQSAAHTLGMQLQQIQKAHPGLVH